MNFVINTETQIITKIMSACAISDIKSLNIDLILIQRT